MKKSNSGSRNDGGGTKDARDHRSRQLNPEHPVYWRSRGLEDRPDEPGHGTPPKPRKR